MMGQLFVVLFPEYHNSRQNKIIIFWKYLVEIRRKALLNLFWEYIQINENCLQFAQNLVRLPLSNSAGNNIAKPE